MKMRVSEIFYSIEGEGIEIGKPEVFIRLAGCNLRCEWCDTEYALGNGKEMSIDEIIYEISRYPCKNVSITGGEPLFQKEEMLKLVKKLKGMNYWIQVNTNGTIFDREVFNLVDLISMDCKCPSSGMESDLEVLKRTKESFGFKMQLKFIIADEEDYRYARKILSILNAPNVVFQPEWNSMEFVKKLVELVKKDGLNVRVIIQQQKMIWGCKRGV